MTVRIEYFGLAPHLHEFVNSEKFQTLLQENPNIKVVTVDEEEDDEVFVELSVPLPLTHDGYVGLLDTAGDDEPYMSVLYDDCDAVSDPTPSFIEVLKLMDEYSIDKHQSRVFMDEEAEEASDILTREFDFTTGKFKQT